jgi:hypothetical protein
VMLDRLVQAEYENDRQAWLADGRPMGYFWRTPEGRGLQSIWAGHRLSYIWLYKTPVWVGRSGKYRSWLWRMRVCMLLWNLILLAAVLISPLILR